MQAIPSGGRPSASVRALQTATTLSRRSAERIAPDGGHGVCGDQRIAQRAGLVAVEGLGLVAIARVGEVEVARQAQQRLAGDRVAGRVGTERDVSLDRREVPPAVEDDRQLLAEREALDAHRDGGRALMVEQRAAQELLGGVVARTGLLAYCDHLCGGRWWAVSVDGRGAEGRSCRARGHAAAWHAGGTLELVGGRSPRAADQPLRVTLGLLARHVVILAGHPLLPQR